METKEKNLEEYSHPEGVEVKVSAARANITILLNLFFFVVGGVILFNYIWGDGSSYGAGYELGNTVRLQALSIKGTIIMALCYIACFNLVCCIGLPEKIAGRSIGTRTGRH